MTPAPFTVGSRPSVDVALEVSCEVFEQVVAGVPADGWQLRSPCGDWTVKDVVGHVVGTLNEIVAIARRQPFDRDDTPPAAAAGDAPLDAVRSASPRARRAVGSADLQEATEAMHGRRTIAEALAFPVADLAVHAWDVAHATGQTLRIPDALLSHVIYTCEQVPEDVLRGPGLFGPAQPADDDADQTPQLMAWLGRDTRPIPLSGSE